MVEMDLSTQVLVVAEVVAELVLLAVMEVLLKQVQVVQVYKTI